MSRPTPSGDWEVLFSRSLQRPGTREISPTAFQSPASPEEPIHGSKVSTCGCKTVATPKKPTVKSSSDDAAVIDLDARGLEPPQPMVRILEALEVLPERTILRARTDRRPLHLLPRLAERGFQGDIEKQSDGSFVTIIRRVGLETG